MRILIIEDEKKVADSLAQSFQKKGYAVDTLEDGNDALTRLSLYRNEYEVVLLDLMIPGLPGREVCAKAREAGVATPILILTGKGDIQDRVDLLQIGADDYLVKPFAIEELHARVQALSRRQPEVLPSILQAHDITLDPAMSIAKRRDVELPLTRKEFVLLEFFMRNPNHVYNREQLMDHLWDHNFSSFSNVVDVHVNKLRKKLGNDGDEIIETVRGAGYRLNA